MQSDKAPLASIIFMARMISFLIVTFFLILNSWFLVYVERLESKKCECAISWHRNILQAVLAIMVVLGVGFLLFSHVVPLFHIMQGIMTVTSIVYIVTAFLFIRRIKHEKCTCAQTAAFKVMNILNIIYIVLICLAIVASVVSRTLTRMQQKN